MRWIISLVVILSLCAQAQEVSMEALQETVSFIFRSGTSTDTEALASALEEQGFTLQTLTPASLPDVVSKVFPLASPGAALFPLSGSSELSPCNNLVLGVVQTSKELDKTLFQGLNAAIESIIAPQLMAGVKSRGLPGGGATTNGEGAHNGGDMASNTSEISSEVSFFANARIKEAQEVAYASKEHESIIAILSTGLNLSENTRDLATMLSPFQMDYVGSDEVSFDTVLDDDYEDYMEPTHLNKGQGTPVAMIAHTVAPVVLQQRLPKMLRA
jgi:hypothetical protein